MSPGGAQRLEPIDVPTADRSSAHRTGPRRLDPDTLGVDLATGDLRSAALQLDELLKAPFLTGHQSLHLLDAAHSTYRALLALDEIWLPDRPPSRPPAARAAAPERHPADLLAQPQPPPPSASATELEAIKPLINRVSWIALVLTPLTSAPPDHDGSIGALVADLDGLIRDLRVTTWGAAEPSEEPLDRARRVLHHVQARLGVCWTERFEAPSDSVHTDLLAEASHLVRSALISLQHGAVP